ncbi:hypothetical protein L873DRAFT_1802756 [Choiromyces venosus 120613-1]|uniref:Uncharacterized protein n=1 Tax=Choiromyces venosus 120613-1 TaxID=1336337 RepID=A0A3N4JU95_9PEZI|nr:hypothetical protein L873DRAFT_1802756 [Choiromyces venosus 120613-1]
MEPTSSTSLEQLACGPNIRYSIDELHEYRSSLSYVVCPVDEFTPVAWAEGLLNRLGEYVPEELAVRKEYAQKLIDIQDEAERLLKEEMMAKRRLQYPAGLSFADFLNLGKYGSPMSSQAGSVSGSNSQQAKVTPPFVKPYVLPTEPESKNETSTIGTIQEKDIHSQSTSDKKAKESSPSGEIVDLIDLSEGVQVSSHAKVVEPTRFVEAMEEAEESGNIVDQDAWINEMLERTKIFSGNKYKRT